MFDRVSIHEILCFPFTRLQEISFEDLIPEDSMSLCHQSYRRAAVLVLLAVCIAAVPALLYAQDTKPPKAEVFVGYQWLNPGGNVPHFDSSGNPFAFKLPSIPQGVGAALAYNFTKNWALEGDYGGNWNKNANESTASIGPKFTWRGEDGINLFAHTLFGINRLTTKGLDPSNGVGAILGGGMDIRVWKPLTLRLFEADFVYARHNFSSVVPPTDGNLRRPTYDGARLRTGLVFNFGGAPPVAPAAACSIDHNEVLVGEPLHVTVAPSNFNPKHTLAYNWSSTGGKIEGKDTGATIDTTGTAPANYTATARVSDPKVKKGGEAS